MFFSSLLLRYVLLKVTRATAGRKSGSSRAGRLCRRRFKRSESEMRKERPTHEPEKTQGQSPSLKVSLKKQDNIKRHYSQNHKSCPGQCYGYKTGQEGQLNFLHMPYFIIWPSGHMHSFFICLHSYFAKEQ